MEPFINIAPTVDKKAVTISVNSIIKVINTCKDARYGDEVVLAALDALKQSLKASADYINISNCNLTNKEVKDESSI